MANVKFNKGLYANLPAQSTEGALYFCTDESIYIGLANGAYHRFGDFIEVANVAALPETAHEKALYYAAEENVLCKYANGSWVQINLNTTYTIAAGATAGSVKLTGSDGKSVEVQVVDVAGLTALIEAADAKGAQGIEDAAAALEAAQAAQKTADDLGDFVGDIPDGYTEETVIAYINKKAEETLNAASGGSSESAASVLAALNTYKSENDPKVQANTDAIAVLNGDTADSVGGQIEAAITELDLANTYEAKGTAVTEAGKVQDALDAEIERATGREDEIAASVVTEKERAEAAEKAINDKIGEVPVDKTVAQMIADAKSEAIAGATYDDTQVKADIKANKDALDVLNGTGVGSVSKAIDDAFNDFSTKVTDDAVVNSYKELIDWAAEHGSEATEMAAAISKLEGILAGIGGEGQKATVIAFVEDAIAGLSINDYATVEALNGAIERISANEGAITTLQGKVTELEGKAHTHTFVESELNKIADGDVAKWNAAQANAEATAKGYTDAEITKLADVYDAKGAAETAEGNAKAFTTEEIGKLSEVYDAKGSADTAEANAIAKANELNTAMDNRVKELEAIDHEAYVGADETNLQAAKDYADAAVSAAIEWSEF